MNTVLSLVIWSGKAAVIIFIWVDTEKPEIKNNTGQSNQTVTNPSSSTTQTDTPKIPDHLEPEITITGQSNSMSVIDKKLDAHIVD